MHEKRWKGMIGLVALVSLGMLVYWFIQTNRKPLYSCTVCWKEHCFSPGTQYESEWTATGSKGGALL